MRHRLAYVDVPYACFGLIVAENGRVTDAAPIARWAIGREWRAVKAFFAGKGLRRWTWTGEAF